MRCPACNGTGFYDSMTSDCELIKCDVCNGDGFDHSRKFFDVDKMDVFLKCACGNQMKGNGILQKIPHRNEAVEVYECESCGHLAKYLYKLIRTGQVLL